MNIEKANISVRTAVVLCIALAGLMTRFEKVVKELRSEWKATRETMWTSGDMHLWEHHLRERNQNNKLSVPSTEEVLRSRPTAIIPKYGPAVAARAE